jgi:asparagine synthase (glutamine-hydrolysing)
MCGIIAVVDPRRGGVSEGLLQSMAATIRHRGPDATGVHLAAPAGLAATRLAIIDLSPEASQPFVSDDGRVAVVHNGELYNFRELRDELLECGHAFKTRTDTEVVLHGYLEWGASCIERFEGMYAFAVWDARTETLFAARDRFGVKPLYWHVADGRLMLASEVKALLAHPRVKVGLCKQALVEYLTFQNVLSDLTLFEGVRLLPPGCTLTARPGDIAPKIDRVWDWQPPEQLELSTEDASEQLERLLEDAVARQLVADVEIGAYLSGGLDSGFISTVAARQMPRLKTFTAGFDLTSISGLELSFDERARAEQLANALKTEHYEVVLHAGDMEWVLPMLVWSLEDLRVGQSYPNYYVARLASKFVKVVLSGAGGDELFGGYPWRYHTDTGGDFAQSYYKRWQRLVPDEDRVALFRPDFLADIEGFDPFDSFKSVFDDWHGETETEEGRVNASLYFELKTFLHGLLVVEDKLSMAHSLETRVPFLDERLVEFALGLPLSMKLAHLGGQVAVNENEPGKRLMLGDRNQGKMILRETLERVVPRNIGDRQKQGFSAPDATWFRGESIDYLSRLLRSKDAHIYEVLQRDYVERILDEHTAGAVNHRLFIWSLLCLEWWMRCFLGGELPEAGRFADAVPGAAQ